MEVYTLWEPYRLPEDYAMKDVESYNKDHCGTKRVKTPKPEDNNRTPEDTSKGKDLPKGRNKVTLQGKWNKQISLRPMQMML
jgi:hypothetical protein